MNEVEIKFRLDGPAEHDRLRNLLAERGATGSGVEAEDNRLFDSPAATIARDGQVLRLRILNGGPAGKLTFKGPSQYDGGVKTRHELEIAVADTATMQGILEALSYRITNSYHKEREAWQLGEIEVALDVLDFGYFCEIEGPANAITALAGELGLDVSRAERSGYPALAARHLAATRASSAPPSVEVGGGAAPVAESR